MIPREDPEDEGVQETRSAQYPAPLEDPYLGTTLSGRFLLYEAVGSKHYWARDLVLGHDARVIFWLTGDDALLEASAGDPPSSFSSRCLEIAAPYHVGTLGHGVVYGAYVVSDATPLSEAFARETFAGPEVFTNLVAGLADFLTSLKAQGRYLCALEPEHFLWKERPSVGRWLVVHPLTRRIPNAPFAFGFTRTKGENWAAKQRVSFQRIIERLRLSLGLAWEGSSEAEDREREIPGVFRFLCEALGGESGDPGALSLELFVSRWREAQERHGQSGGVLESGTFPADDNAKRRPPLSLSQQLPGVPVRVSIRERLDSFRELQSLSRAGRNARALWVPILGLVVGWLLGWFWPT